MHPLHLLDELVSRAFHLSAGSSECLHAKAFCKLLEEAVTESGKVRSVMLNQAFANKHKKQMKVFVHTYQAICVDLCNKVFEGGRSIGLLPYNNITLTAMLQKQRSILDHLLSLLYFIEHHFSRYFDKEQSIPRAFIAIERENMVTNFGALQETLKVLLGSEMVEILREPVTEFIEGSSNVAYSTYFHIKTYLACLHSLSQSQVPANISPVSLLIYRLAETGYCPQRVISYYLTECRQEVLLLESVNEMQQFWREEIKNIKLLPASAGSLGQTLVSALSEEMNAVSPPAVLQASSTLANTKEKVLETPMSVAQLGLFIRILVESGTIKCKNQAQLLRMIADSFHTKKTTSISPESLRVKYYATDPASVNIVKEYVIRMMNQLRTYN